MKGLGPTVAMLVLMSLVIPSAGSGSEARYHTDESELDIPVRYELPDEGFMENLGQLTGSNIRFYTTGNYRAGLLDDGVVFALDMEDLTFSYEMRFFGCRDVEPVGHEPDITRYNFLTGSGENHVSGARKYSSVLYPEIYDGIDILFYDLNGALKYDIIVSPGASPDDVIFEYSGIEGLETLPTGDLVIRTIAGDFLDRGLIAFQGKESIDVDLSIRDSTVGFRVGEYDDEETLIIDPYLEYSTRLGGTSTEEPANSMVEHNDALYISGTTYSTDFPATPGAYDIRMDSQDVFVAKVSTDLRTIIYATYLGGTSSDMGHDIDVDPYGNVYVTGQTYSTDFPTTKGAMNETSQIGYGYTRWGYLDLLPDGFVTRLSPGGSSLEYSTFITGNRTENCVGIEVDDNGHAYVCGVTESGNFRTKNAYQDELKGYGDVFVMKIVPDGSDVSYSTFIGGKESQWYEEFPYDIDLDGEGKAVICGYSGEESYPTTSGAYRTTGMWEIAFVTMLTSDGTDLEFSTYIADETYLQGVSAFSDGIYLTGTTYSSSFPLTSDAYDNQMGGWSDAIFTILSKDGSRLVYSTFLGGAEYEVGESVRKDEKGQAVLTGYTYSTDFPKTPNGYSSSSSGNYDMFLTQFTPDRKGLNYSSVYGGMETDYGMDTYVRNSNEIYVMGYTYSSDYPTTPGAIKESVSQREPDLVLSKFKLSSEVPGPPRGVGIENGNHTLNITWSPPLRDGNETLANYSIYRSEHPPAMFRKIADLPPDAAFFPDTGLENGERYYYHITAENIVGEGLPSKTVSGVPARPPGPPYYIATETGDGFINLTWDYPPDDGGDPLITFNVYAGAGISPLLKLVSGLDRTWFNHTGLVNGQTYNYRISSVNSMGEGPLSRSVQDYPARPPGPPLNLHFNRGDHFVHLFWDPPEDDGGAAELSYTVLMSGNNVTFETVEEGVMGEEHNMTGLENGEYWIFAVRAKNIKGYGEPSEIVQTASMGLPSAPAGLEASPGDGFIDLEWDPPESFGGTRQVYYCVYIMVAGSPWELYKEDLAQTELRIPDLTNGVRYDLMVSARNIMGEGALSENVFSVPIGLPSAPLDLNATAGDSSVRLAWKEPVDMGGEGFVSYTVFMGTVESDLHFLGTTTSNVFMVMELKNGQEYHFLVAAVNSLGQGNPSPVVVVTPLALPGTPEIRAVEAGDSSITLRWKDLQDKGGDPEVTYRLYLWRRDGSDELHNIDVEGLVYVFTGLVNGVRYEIALSAFNERGEGTLSDVHSLIPMTVPGGMPVLNLTPGIGSIMISWSLPEDDGGDDISMIRLYKGTEPDMMRFYRDINASRGSFTDMNVMEGMAYHYRASCINSAGEGPSSGAVSSTTLAPKEEASLLGPILTGGIVVITLLALLVVVILVVRSKRKGSTYPLYPAVPPGGQMIPQFGTPQEQAPLPPPASAPQQLPRANGEVHDRQDTSRGTP